MSKKPLRVLLAGSVIPLAWACGNGDTVDTSEGRRVFAATCADSDCHGEDGVSGPAPDLDEIVPTRSDAQLRDVVLNGTGTGEDEMPAQDLSEDEVEDLLLFLRNDL